jgi:hypothetical protein
MNQAVDPELRAIHFEALNLYNREISIARSVPTIADSIRATSFLAEQATIFADAALILMEDARQPLNVPAALLRTCLEAQARSNHIIAAKGGERENRASELVKLMHIGHEYYYKSAIQQMKDFISDESKLLPRDRPYFAGMKSMANEIDTSNLVPLKRQYKQISNNWTYGKVIERDKFSDPASLNRSEVQPLQPMLDLTYMQCCAFVHCDPASIQHRQLLTPVSVVYSLVLTEMITIFCFFVALGKEKDQDLVNLKKRIMTFDINERILPKKDIPANWSHPS